MMADDAAWTPPVTFLDSNGAAIPPGEGGAGHAGDAQWSPPATFLDENGQPTQPVGAPAPAPPSILRNGWRAAGTELLDAGTRGAGLGTRDVLTGASAPLTGLLDVLTWPGRVASRAAGLPTTAPSDLASKVIDATNLPTPVTPTEKNISTFNQGAAATLPSLVVGGVPALAARVPSVAAPLVSAPTGSVPQVARVLATGGTGAVAGEKAAESEVVPTWAKPYANIAASIAAARFADAGLNLGAKTVNAVRNTNMSPAYQAFARAGIEPRLVGTMAGGDSGSSVEASLSRMPFASARMRPAQERTVQEFGDSVERTASQLDPNGVAVTPQRTGEALQDAARHWINNVFNGPQGMQETAWAPLNQRMAGAAVNPSGFRTALGAAAAPPRLSSLPETQQAWGNPQARSWLAALNNDVGRSGNITWDQARAIRTRIGDAMGTPAIVEGVGAQQLRDIYGSLTDDLGNAATAHGQGALFNNANAVSTRGHAFIDNTLRKVVKANNPIQETVDPEQATKSILNGGDTHVQAIRDNMPDAADLLAAYRLRQAQTANPSVATAYDDTSTGKFLSNVNRMRQQTPDGYDALYNTPGVRRQVDDLATVAGRLRATERHLNTSGTAEQLGWMEYARQIIEHAANQRYGAMVMSAVVPPVVGKGAGWLMTNPDLARLVSAGGAGPAPLRPSITGLLGSSANMPTITVRPERRQ